MLNKKNIPMSKMAHREVRQNPEKNQADPGMNFKTQNKKLPM
jgi:hypothetical protein